MRIRFFAPVQLPTEAPVKRVDEESINDESFLSSDYGADSTMSIEEDASFEIFDSDMSVLPEMNDGQANQLKRLLLSPLEPTDY